MKNTVTGFSKLSKEEKINWITTHYFETPEEASNLLKKYWHSDKKLQQLHDDFIENTVSNFYVPFGVAPNFLINEKHYALPMAIEESSVVAAAAKSASFWANRGGFKTKVISTEKVGQVHFFFKGNFNKLNTFFKYCEPIFLTNTLPITHNMQKRGGGITKIELRDKTTLLDNYYQLHVIFETKNSMGANFINSCLEIFSQTLTEEAQNYALFSEEEKKIKISMSILSNYIPNCLVRAEVSCLIEDLREKNIPEPLDFAQRFVQAVNIAEVEPYRAVTHNKGIMNGIDAIVVATGNDFRAVEAGVHAYASKNGTYSSLSHASIENDRFHFWLEIPLALGTVGGLTSLHPMVKLALELLKKPSAEMLMQQVAVAGLAQNFAAIRSLITTGIQAGHMKMHLNNILNQFEATEEEKESVKNHFKNHVISHHAVVSFIENLRKI